MHTDGVHCRESAGTDRASKPQGSSEQVLPWQVTLDQFICTSLSHTQYWYEVGMLKVPAFIYYTIIVSGRYIGLGLRVYHEYKLGKELYNS